MREALSRPRGILVATVLSTLAGMIELGIGLFMFIAGLLLNSPGSWGPMVAVLGLIIASPGVLNIFVAGGIWRGWLWTWLLGIVLNTVIIYNCYHMLVNGEWLNGTLLVIAPAVIIVSLLTPGARRAVGMHWGLNRVNPV